MIITAEKKTLKRNDTLSHLLRPRPWALDSADRVMRKTNKSTLACQGVGLKNIAAADMIAQPCERELLTEHASGPEEKRGPESIC